MINPLRRHKSISPAIVSSVAVCGLILAGSMAFTSGFSSLSAGVRAASRSNVVAPPRSMAGQHQARSAMRQSRGTVFSAAAEVEIPVKSDTTTIDSDTAAELYQDMQLGRKFEDATAQWYQRGKVFGFVHLANGQEAVSTGAIKQLRKDDYICST
eukprot:1392924-Amorphochlora_amoeboformis.AAC.1